MDFIKIGILQSFAESPLQSNKFLLEALQLAIDEINNSGGVLGLPIKPIFEDGGHSPVTFREKVRKLIRKDKIKFIFGVWQHFDNLNTNYEIRKAIKKEVEAHEVLFWYSLPYEGLEESQYIFFTGDIINQRVEAMVEWMLTKKWTNLYLIGQNNLHSGISNKLLKTLVTKNKGKIVGETFLNNENRDFDHLENELKQSKPDIIVNTLLGISNENLFNALSKAQNVIKKIPIISANLEQTSQENLTLFSCSSYFPAYQNKINKEFIKNFRQKYGKTQPITSGDAMIYSLPFIWKQLLEKSGSTNIKKIRHQAVNETFELPQGIVRIKENFHLSKKMKIAKISAEKEFEIIWETETPIQPLPWVGYEHIDNRNLPLLKDILGNIPNLIPLGDMVEKEVNEKTKEYIKDKDHLKTMFDTMNEGIALNEMVFNNRGEMIDYRIAEVNNAFYKLAGIKNDNVIGKLATEIYGLPQKMITEFWKNHRNAKEVEYNEYHSPVTDKSFLVASSPFKENKFITSFVEITERLKVEEALRQSDLRYRKYFELGLLGMAMIKPDHQWIEFNQKLSEILGFTHHALRQITWR